MCQVTAEGVDAFSVESSDISENQIHFNIILACDARDETVYLVITRSDVFQRSITFEKSVQKRLVNHYAILIEGGVAPISHIFLYFGCSLFISHLLVKNSQGDMQPF